MIVADTSVLVDFLRGHEGARATFDRLGTTATPIVTSVLSKVEVLAGMRADEETHTRAFLDAIDSIAVDDEIAEQAGAFARQYLRSHPGIETVDYVIAASTRVLNASLWTRNLKHFPMFPDLTAPY